MKDYFLKYAIVLGKRYTFKQKKNFIEAIGADFGESGYTAQVKESRRATGRSTNLYIGDVDKAKLIFLAAYDTCSKYYLPDYEYYPFNPEKNIGAERKNILFIGTLSVLLLIPLYMLISSYGALGVGLKIVSGALIAALVYFLYRFISGIPNPVNYSRNSASIVLMRGIAESLKASGDVAFILVDYGTASYAGFKAVAGDLGEAANNRKFILLDSMAAGESIICAHGADMAQEYEKFKAYAPWLDMYDKEYTKERAETLAFGLFKNSVAFACGNIVDKQFLIKGTRSKKDYELDLDRLEKLKKMFVKYCENM